MQPQTSAEILADLINRQLPDVKSGTLRFFGVWFGRPYDNVHTIRRAEAEHDCLRIAFDQDEVLRVWQPAQCSVSATCFEIVSAARVLWGWFYYGRPHTEQNRYHYDFLVENGEVKAETNVDWHKPALSPIRSEPAVRMY